MGVSHRGRGQCRDLAYCRDRSHPEPSISAPFGRLRIDILSEVLPSRRHVMEARRFAIGDQVYPRLDRSGSDNLMDVYTISARLLCCLSHPLFGSKCTVSSQGRHGAGQVCRHNELSHAAIRPFGSARYLPRLKCQRMSSYRGLTPQSCRSAVGQRQLCGHVGRKECGCRRVWNFRKGQQASIGSQKSPYHSDDSRSAIKGSALPGGVTSQSRSRSE
jgi:hypothetical protein